MRTTAARSEARRSQLRAEQIDTAFGRRGRPYVVAMVVMVGAYVQSAIVWSAAPHGSIARWAALVTLCQIGSMLLITAYRRANPQGEQLRTWGMYKVVQTTLLSLAWGSGLILLHVPGEPVTLLVPAMSAVAVTMASTVTNASYPPGMYPLLIGNVAPGIVYLLGFASGGANERAVGYALIALLIIVVIGGIIISRLIRETMLGRMELADAAEHERMLHEQAEFARARTNRFFSAASHDLRQPVHALGLYMTLLRKDPPEAERRSLIASVGHCVEGLEQLFSAILGVAETETQGILPGAPLPLQGIFEQATVQFSHIAESKGLRLRVVPTSLWVRADATALGRIVGNLVDNAIRYTSSGSVLIGARRDGSNCTILVQDSGIGIAPQDHNRIFDDFFQAGNPERDRGKGLGLGLATVRRLCEARAYELSVRSKLGKGSRFSVRLPRVEASGLPGVVPDAASPAHDGALRVLLVEDDPLVRDAMQRTLESWDMNVRVCANGAQALDILGEATPGRWHVLLDYRLAEGETGLAVADRIRARFHPPPEITIVTGESDPAVHAAAAERGILVLGKPVKPLRLRAVLSAQRAPGVAAQ